MAKNQVLQDVYRIDPLKDPRWAEFVATHPRASVFHSSAWLESLRRTYGYQPAAYTTSVSNEKLRNAVVFNSIDSWLTGRRIVSLPFSDHCELLVDDPAELEALYSAVEREHLKNGCQYVELRPISRLEIATDLFRSQEELCHHSIDLRPDTAELFRGFHKSSTQRKIKRAEREKLTYQEGRSESLLETFWKLTLLTRRRHRVPPQPRKWFRNLIDCFGDSLNIMTAYKGNRPIAAILTIRHQGKLNYKYGCSDARFHNLGGMHLLFWRAIQKAKSEGISAFDLGRSNIRNAGLIKFKDHWGAQRSPLFYMRFSTQILKQSVSVHSSVGWKLRYAGPVIAHAPDGVLSLLGKFLYKHIG